MTANPHRPELVHELEQRSFAGSVYVEIPPATRFLFFGVAGLGLLASAALLTPVVLLLPLVFLTLLWRREEPPVLLFICAIQWLQVASDVFYVNTSGSDLAPDTAASSRASWLSCFGLVTLALGMRLGIAGLPSVALRQAASLDFGQNLGVTRLFIAHLIAFTISFAARQVLFLAPGLSTLFASIVYLKFVFFFLLAYVVWRRRQGWTFLVISTLLELAYGVSGFFSGFKGVLFLLIMVFMISRQRLTSRLVLGGGFMAGLMILCLVVWSAVKVPYREFLNQGSGQQEELVPMGERYAKLLELVGMVGQESLGLGFQTMIKRIAYTSYFAKTLQYVPDVVPHENGALWRGNILHVLQPRLFFPGKSSIDDSELTSYYTGERVAGADQGTSISLGYMAECYVDFGQFWMHLPIFLIGLAHGLIYRYFLTRPVFPLLGMGVLAGVFALQFHQFEMAGKKLTGGMVSTFILYAAFVWLMGRPLQHWLSPGTSPSRPNASASNSRGKNIVAGSAR